MLSGVELDVLQLDTLDTHNKNEGDRSCLIGLAPFSVPPYLLSQLQFQAMRNWLGHDGCYDYHPTVPHFDQAALAHMQYSKLPSTRELHVGKLRNADRVVLKDNYMDIKERWKS